MHKVIGLIVLLLVAGCQPTTIEQTDARMEGEPARVRITGYDDMCEREPNSALCEEEGE